ncbi:MAG TPA: hypothetical protein VLM85_27580 [Polyangiaceae bacterium]|nr:hypothetical protein [Polyangiaceae bacterium]
MPPTKKAKPSRTKKIPAPADVAVKVDGQLKKLWDQQRAVLEQAQAQGAKSFDVLWEAVDAIVSHDPPLYVVGDYGSAREFFAKAVHETERTALRNIRVARYASAAQEEKFGVSMLDAALGYIEAKNGGPLNGKAPIDFDRLKIPVKVDGATHQRTLAEVTVKDIQAATSKLTNGANRKPKSDTYRALSTELSAQKPLAGVEVSEHAGIFSFRNVPAGALAHFGNAVIRGAGKAPVTKKAKASKR